MLATRRQAASRRPGGAERTAGRSRSAARFEVLERIGEGKLWVSYRVRLRSGAVLGDASGATPLAEQPAPNTVLALKALRAQASRVPRLRAALEANLARWMELREPGLCRLYEVGVEEETLYFVSDFLPGGSLEGRITRGGLKSDQVRRLLREVTLPLVALHTQNIAHGDVRPCQILFDANDHATLTDGGFAQAFAEAGLSLADVQGEVAHYLAPERTQNARFSPPADMYALGATLYKMLTGRVPFDGPSALAIAARHRNDLVLAPSQLNPRVSGDLDALALQLLEKNPAARPTAEDVLHLLRGEPSRSKAVPPGMESHVADSANGTSKTPATHEVIVTSAATAATATAATAAAPIVNGVTASVAAAPVTAAPVTAAPVTMPPITTEPLIDVRAPKRRPLDVVVEETVAQEAEQRRQQDFKKARRRHKWREFWGLIGAMFMLTTLVAGGAGLAYSAYNWWLAEVPQAVVVPRYIGKKFDDAKVELSKKGLGIKVVREAYDPKKPAGTVIAGEPEPGRLVRSRREVLVTVSAGEAPIRMLDFTRISLPQARNIIQRHGMRLGPVVEQYHSQVPRGLIAGQFPEAGAPFRRREPITLIISRGPQPKEMDASNAPLATDIPIAPPEESTRLGLPPADFAPLQPIQSEASEGNITRVAKVSVTVPEDGGRQMVRVIVRDANGEKTAYQKMHPPGITVTRSIKIERAPSEVALVRVYVGDVLISENEV